MNLEPHPLHAIMLNDLPSVNYFEVLNKRIFLSGSQPSNNSTISLFVSFSQGRGNVTWTKDNIQDIAQKKPETKKHRGKRKISK